jgi:hypothetical protein
VNGAHSELSRDAVLVVNVCDWHHSSTSDGGSQQSTAHIIAGTSLPLFSKRNMFRNGECHSTERRITLINVGMYDLHMHAFKPGDGLDSTRTPAKLPITDAATTTPAALAADGLRLRQFAKLAKRHRTGLIDKVDWLDRLAFRELELMNEKGKRASRSLYLIVEFGHVLFNGDEHRIVYYERNADDMVYTRPRAAVVHDIDWEVSVHASVPHALVSHTHLYSSAWTI